MPATIIRQLKIYERMPPHRSAESRTLNPVLFGAIVVWIACFASSINAGESRSDHRPLSQLFGESAAPDAMEVVRVARQLPPEERYRYLLKQVLPEDSNTIRLTVDYLPTSPSPPVLEMYGADESPLITVSDENRRASGGVLISPSIELVKAARQVGKLEELREEILQHSSNDVEQIKAQLAIQILIGWTVEDSDRAGELLNQLNGIVRSSQVVDFDRSPESVVIWSGLSSAATRTQVYDLLYLLYEQIHTPGMHHRERFKRHISSLKFQIDQVLDAEAPDGPGVSGQLSLNQWKPVSRQTAESRGEGFPGASWVSGRASARKITCHDDDYLYFASPLNGDFEIEGYLTPYDLREIRLAVGGYWAGSRFTLNECENGFFRHLLPIQTLVEPMTNTNSLLRARVVVRNGVRTTYINGREIYERSHGADADPWIAIYCPWNTSGTAENLRITGSPEIPTEIDMISSSDLPGWLPYFGESAGGADTDWRLIASEAENSHVLIGRSFPELRGAHQESLLRYHRPMLEDGTIEYEFYYEDGSVAVVPALDRCCFLFDRDRIGVHWLTDGRYDRTGLDPANFTAIATFRAETNPVPLIPNEWNRARLTLKGDRIEIALNGETIMTRTLEPENQRTFGLFHYADQTEVRVRNLRWRGNWPKELPPLAEQELADLSLENGLANGPELPVVFEHDFSNGLPPEKTLVSGFDWHQHVEQRSTGVKFTRLGGFYKNNRVAMPIGVEGDFDITLEFTNFQSNITEGGYSELHLNICLDDKRSTEIGVSLRPALHANNQPDRVIQATFFERLNGTMHYGFPSIFAEESTAGKLRVVRRGADAFFLYQAFDSPHFRLVHRQHVSDSPVILGGIVGILVSHLEGDTSVDLKRITVRAEKKPQYVLSQPLTIRQLDEQRLQLGESVSIDLNRETSLKELIVIGDPAKVSREKDSWLVKQSGSNDWRATGFHFSKGIRGDFDITLEMDVLKLERARLNDDSTISLHVGFDGNKLRAIEIKFDQTDSAHKELDVAVSIIRQDNSAQYFKLQQRVTDNATQLRIARRGPIAYLIAKRSNEDDPQIVGRLKVGESDVSRSSVRTLVHTGGEGRETIVRFKSLKLFATGFK